MMQQLPLWRLEQPCLPGMASQQVVGIARQRHDSLALVVWFERAFALKVDLQLHMSNKTTVYYRFSQDKLILRLHRLFLTASATILQAVVRFVRGERDAGTVLDAFVAKHLPDTDVLPLTRMQHRGAYYDLAKILQQTNMLYFHGAGTNSITWGKAERRVKPRLHRLAIYVVNLRLIVVHPCLDHCDVPAYILQWLLYKTLLHELFDIDGQKLDQRVKPNEIAILETCHPEYTRANQWLQAHQDQLRQHHQHPSQKSCGLRRLRKDLPRIG